MTTGIGFLPVGTGPFGFGVPPSAAVPPTGPAGSRYINPATRDYQQDPATGQLKQMPPLRQRVLLTLLTVAGSSAAVPTMGVTYPRKMGDDFEAQVKAAVRYGMRQMTDIERVMRIDSIVVERGFSGRGRITLSYTDLTTGLADRVSA